MTRKTTIFDDLFLPRELSDRESAGRYRAFAQAHVSVGLVSLAIGAVYLTLIGLPGVLAGIALFWLLTPLAIAFLPRMGLRHHSAQLVALGNMTALLTYLTAITGGLNSFLLIWFIAVPVEAAVAGSRRIIALSIAMAASGIGAILGLQTLGMLPSPILTIAPDSLYFTFSTIAAIAYAGLIAVSAQKNHIKAEKEARAGEQHYRFLADNALDMIIRHRPDGSISFISPACEAILGYTHSEMLEIAPGGLSHPDDVQKVQAAFARATYFGEDTTIEFRMRHRDGHYVWVEMRCHPVPVGMAHGQRGEDTSTIYEIIAVARDISKAKSYQDELVEARDDAEEANRTKSAFLANISHELRTPLNAIIGFSDVMKQEIFGPLKNEKYEEYAEAIYDSGHHLIGLINDLLDMSKIDAGRYQIIRESVFLPLIIEDCLRLIRLQAEKAGVQLKVDLPPKLSKISADPRSCKQILLNLLSNSIKFTPKGGSITVRCREQDGYVLLEVEDTGIGIAEEDIKRLGRPFEQVHTSDGEKGTGLGLALVKSLAELHGGRSAILSEPGAGTLVRVILPVAETESPDHASLQFLSEVPRYFLRDGSEVAGAARHTVERAMGRSDLVQQVVDERPEPGAQLLENLDEEENMEVAPEDVHAMTARLKKFFGIDSMGAA